MCTIQLTKLHPQLTPPPDLPGVRYTFDLPDLPATVQTWQDLLDWLRNNPEFLSLIIAAILALLGGVAPPRATP